MTTQASTAPESVIRIDRREVDAIVTDDGWTACGKCSQRFGFRIVATEDGARVKCANGRCGYWVRLGPRLRESVSRLL